MCHVHNVQYSSLTPKEELHKPLSDTGRYGSCLIVNIVYFKPEFLAGIIFLSRRKWKWIKISRIRDNEAKKLVLSHGFMLGVAMLFFKCHTSQIYYYAEEKQLVRHFRIKRVMHWVVLFGPETYLISNHYFFNVVTLDSPLNYIEQLL